LTFSNLVGQFDQVGGLVGHGVQHGTQTVCCIGLRMMVLSLSRDNLLGHGHGHEHEHDIILFTSVYQLMVNYECTIHFVTGCPYNSSSQRPISIKIPVGQRPEGKIALASEGTSLKENRLIV